MDEKPARKRARSDPREVHEPETQPTTGFEKVAAATRDSDYWLEDGNLILVSQGVAFRIYRGLLAEHSGMFRSMFDIAQGLPATEDIVDGCPVVPLDDSPNDLRELFKLIFPLSSNIKFNGRKVDINFISTIIRLDHKYELKGLYEEAINHLTTFYTTSFDMWADGRHATDWRPDPAHAIRAISLARLANTPSILPTAFYICATLGPDLVHGFPMADEDAFRERLAPEDLRLCLELKARLAVENARAAFLIFRFPASHVCEDKPGPRCSEVWPQILEQAGVANEKVPHPVASERALDSWVADADCVPARRVWPTSVSAYTPTFVQPTLCTGCRNHLEARDREVRRQVWARLPEFIGLTIENWDA